METTTAAGFQDILSLALDQGQGLYFILFIYLVFYILKDGQKREDSQTKIYGKLIEDLNTASQKIASIEDSVSRNDEKSNIISRDIAELKFIVQNINENIDKAIANKKDE